MAKKIPVPKELKEFGVYDAVQNGNKIEMMIDPSNLPKAKQIKLATGLSNASASTLTNDPYLATYYENPSMSYLNTNVHEKIKVAMRYFNQDPLAGRIIEMMTVFSNDGFKNESSNPKLKKFYDDWCRYVDITQVHNWEFLEYYRSGNVATYRELAAYKDSTFDISPPARASLEFDISSAAKKHMYTKKVIPVAYTILNPLTVYVDKIGGGYDNLYLSTKEIKVDPTSSSDMNSLRIMNAPTDMQKFNNPAGIPLNRKNVRRILRMRQPYEPYGSVMMERAFGALHEKNKLRQMDMSMVNAVINQIIKVTIGNDKYPATQPQMKRLAETFRNVGKSQVIFWNHTLNIEVIRPDSKVLNKEKYARIDEDIRNAFGISEVLLGGGGKGNFANAFLSLKAFLTNLQQGRADIIRWTKSEYEDIAEAMQFDSIPEPSFNELSLTDEIAEKQIIIQLIDRGIISYKSAQLDLGYDPYVEIKRRTEEKSLVDNHILGPVALPFQGGSDGGGSEAKMSPESSMDKSTREQNNLESGKGKQPKAPKTMVQAGGGSGRPKDARGKKMVGRTKLPKVKGQASLEEEEPVETSITKEEVLKIAEELSKRSK